MRIVFLGTGDIGVPSLRALAATHEIAGVYTQPDRPAGRDLKLRPSPIKAAALELNLPVFQPEKIRQCVPELEALKPEVIVVVAYGQILPKSILCLPPLGCLNVHASLLPRHRGASPIHAAILAGDAESGVTIMQMDEGLDTGDILLKATTPISDQDTGGILHDRLAQLAPAPLETVLAGLVSGAIIPEKQDDALATYAPKLSRQDGEISWIQSAREIDLRIRAMTPWPGAFTHLPGEAKAVLKVHRATPLPDQESTVEPGTVLRQDQSGLLVAAGEGGLLLTEVQAPGGKRMAAADYFRGKPLPERARLS